MDLKKLLSPMKKVRQMVSEYKMTHADRVFVSFGENCLTDNILERHHVKSFSTPYSSGRSNIEYILQIERACFEDFLNPEYLEYAYLDGRRVVRLKQYMQVDNTYNPWHMVGFEFTHHDVLGEGATREKMRRRTARMQNLRNRELNIFYHSRPNPATDTEMLILHLNELKKIYERRCKTVNIYMFTQVIVENASARRIERLVKDGIHIYIFHVLHEWAGSDQDVFWARCDDDLIGQMIRDALHGEAT